MLVPGHFLVLPNSADHGSRVDARRVRPATDDDGRGGAELRAVPEKAVRGEQLEGLHARGLPDQWRAVEANGGSHNRRRIGGYGHAEAFSLHPSKIINACANLVICIINIQNSRNQFYY